MHFILCFCIWFDLIALNYQTQLEHLIRCQWHLVTDILYSVLSTFQYLEPRLINVFQLNPPIANTV